MSWRVWRRKKLLSGVLLGLSRSGPSLRFGVRGAGVTVGGRYGLRTTVGIPGTGVYYTTVRRRGPRSSPAVRSTYTSASNSRAGVIGWLWVLGIVVAIGATIATYGLILIPIALCLIGWGWYHVTRPSFKAGRLIRQATQLSADRALPVMHQAMALDPQGQATLKACGNWFAAQNCWQDACEAYGDYLHIGSDWNVEAAYTKSLLAAGHFDEAITRLDQLRTMSWLTEESRATLISGLALGWMHKGDFQQARAVLDTAGLQRRNLGVGLQQCLAMRAACSYLQGQRAKAVTDMDRLYAINPAYPNLAETKSDMSSGTFKLDDPQPFPAWYPTSSAGSASAIAESQSEKTINAEI